MRFEGETGLPGMEVKRIEGRDARKRKLDSLQIHGDKFESERQYKVIKEKILAVGLPVDNFKSLAKQKNRRGREDLLASWGTGKFNKGEFTVYELLDRQVPEKQLGTIVHENIHGSTPLSRENAFLYGSEEKRAEAEKVVRGIAAQSIDTNTFLNGYHAWLYKQMVLQNEGKQMTGITREIFDEETGAIVAELAMTNRKKLVQVEAAQHASIDRRFGAGQLKTNKKVNLMSHEAEEGSPFVQVDGADKILINLIDGVKDYKDLKKHINSLKQQFYPDDGYQKVIHRESLPVDIGAFYIPSRPNS